MKRSWQESRFQHRLPCSRLDESHAGEPANLVLDPDDTIKGDQVRATAEEHVLAVVHDLPSSGMFVRRSAASEIGTAFEDGYAETAVRERARGGKAGQSASDDRHCGLCGTISHHRIRFTNPFARMTSFSRRLKLTRRENTS